MPTLFYLPGFSSSELYLDNGLTDLYWWSASRVVLLTPGAMELDALGVHPAGLFGRELFAGNPLQSYSAAPVNALVQGLAPHGYNVRPIGYDWRLNLVEQGRRLAALVRQSATVQDPATLVGHSAGGLVCRFAWVDLVRSGETALVRRIVTIGTPHWGTYYPVAMVAGQADPVKQLLQLVQTIGGPFGAGLAGLPGNYTLAVLVAVALTWPAVYQLLPNVGAPDAAADPHRAELYTAANWSTVGGPVSALHLGATLNVVAPLCVDPVYLIPPWVLTTASGTGFTTFDRLMTASDIGTVSGLGSSADGDGTVTSASAEAEATTVYRYTARHNDLPGVMAGVGDLVATVLDQRAAPIPPPRLTLDTTPVAPGLGGPPLSGLNATPTQAQCAGGICSSGC